MKIKLNVTENDIREGKPYDCNECPIAISLLRHGEKPYVGESIRLTIDGKRYMARKSANISRFIFRFDVGGILNHVSPFHETLNFREIKS